MYTALQDNSFPKSMKFTNEPLDCNCSAMSVFFFPPIVALNESELFLSLDSLSVSFSAPQATTIRRNFKNGLESLFFFYDWRPSNFLKTNCKIDAKYCNIRENKCFFFLFAKELDISFI